MLILTIGQAWTNRSLSSNACGNNSKANADSNRNHNTKTS